MSDSLDHLINDAFTDFDAAERDSYRPAPGPAAVRHTVLRRRRIRTISLGVVGVLLVAVPLMLIVTGPRGAALPPAVVPTTGPTSSPTPTPTLTPSPTPTATTPAAVLNATLTLPAFPGEGVECGGAGKRTFVNGVASIGDGAWTIGAMVPIEADLDGAPGKELLTSIHCATQGSVHPTQLIALKVGGAGGLSVLGYVIMSPDVRNLAFDVTEVRVEAAVVLVTTTGPYQSDGWPLCHRQVRGYAYRSGAFKQVSGPTAFPDLTPDIGQIDFRNAGLLVSINNPTGGGGAVYCVSMVNGSGAAKVYVDGDPAKGSVANTFTIGPVSLLTDHILDVTVAAAIVTYGPPAGPTTQSVQVFVVDSGVVLGNVIQTSGVDGITNIAKVEASGDQLTVSVTADGKSQVWTYGESRESGTWRRVS